MTAFDIIVPALALGVGLAGAWIARRASRNFDQNHRPRHPAE